MILYEARSDNGHLDGKINGTTNPVQFPASTVSFPKTGLVDKTQEAIHCNESYIESWFANTPNRNHLISLVRRDYPSDPEDIIQETHWKAIKFLRANENLYYHPSQVKMWLTKIAYNTINDKKRRERIRGQYIVYESELNESDTSNVPFLETITDGVKSSLDSLILHERAELLMKALSQLPAEMREIVILREGYGLECKDLADRNGLPIWTVRRRVREGRDLLVTLMGQSVQQTP